jgi:prepilin-type N-terminal cleavage/methylation domain-containing protein
MLTRGRARRDSVRDGGFTLVELVISIAILGVVMVAITGALIVALKANKETDTRLDESRDVQFSSTWFGDDVQSANRISTSGSPNCGTDPDTALVVKFANTDIAVVPASPPVVTTDALTVSYVLRPAATGGGKELHRLACSPAAGVPMDTVVARLLSGVAADAPSVACPPVACSDPGARKVTLTLTAQRPTPTGAGFTYTLQGTRRSS